jgi:glutathione synthase/RimK-type ligase-like ATP-grasp enzyme
MAANNSKPYQLALIAACGFAVPDTLVTTDAAAVRRFCRRHGTVIYKSVSGVRSIVSRLDAVGRDALADVANCPTQFQEYVPGSDMRVHVMGDALLATEIRSDADDYRYASRSGADVAMAPATLPEDVAEACRAMVRTMGLLVAGIDLRRTPAGAWFCFEVNPSPGFTYFEAAAGQPIAAAIADLLLHHDRAAASPAVRKAGHGRRTAATRRGSRRLAGREIGL